MCGVYGAQTFTLINTRRRNIARTLSKWLNAEGAQTLTTCNMCGVLFVLIGFQNEIRAWRDSFRAERFARNAHCQFREASAG